jgi:hypothetical protein
MRLNTKTLTDIKAAMLIATIQLVCSATDNCYGQINGISAFSCTETKVVTDENDNQTRKWVVLNRCRTVGIVANLKIITKTYKIGSEDTTYTIKDTCISYLAPGEMLFLGNEACEKIKGNRERCLYYKKWTSKFK